MGFDTMATGWDTARRIERAGKVSARIEAALQPVWGGRLLEFGCGTGLVSFGLPESIGDITLLDSSAGMIEKTREKIAALGRVNMHTLLLDITQKPYSGQPFDAIYSSLVLHHVKPLDFTLRRLREMLTKGGVLCVVDLDPDDGSFHRHDPGFDGCHGFSHEDFAAALARAGFRDTRIETFYHGEKEVDGATRAYSLFCAAAYN